MMHTKISDPYISKERFDYLWDVRIMIDYPQWVEYINNRLDYFTWLEETEEGKNRLSNIDKIPQSFKDKILKLHDKKEACAEFNTKKGYYEIIINYNWEFGTIGTTFQKIITKKDLRRLLDMANYLDAFLLNNGNEIIDEDISVLKTKI